MSKKLKLTLLDGYALVEPHFIRVMRTRIGVDSTGRPTERTQIMLDSRTENGADLTYETIESALSIQKRIDLLNRGEALEESIERDLYGA